MSRLLSPDSLPSTHKHPQSSAYDGSTCQISRGRSPKQTHTLHRNKPTRSPCTHTRPTQFPYPGWKPRLHQKFTRTIPPKRPSPSVTSTWRSPSDSSTWSPLAGSKVQRAQLSYHCWKPYLVASTNPWAPLIHLSNSTQVSPSASHTSSPSTSQAPSHTHPITVTMHMSMKATTNMVLTPGKVYAPPEALGEGFINKVCPRGVPSPPFQKNTPQEVHRYSPHEEYTYKYRPKENIT